MTKKLSKYALEKRIRAEQKLERFEKVRDELLKVVCKNDEEMYENITKLNQLIEINTKLLSKINTVYR